MIKSSRSLFAIATLGILFVWSAPAQVSAQGTKPKAKSPAASPASSPKASPSPKVSPSPAASAAPVATNVETPPGADGEKPDDGGPPTTDTEILASQGANFASRERIAVFIGDVRVTDPRFTLACDKLTVYLAKNATTDTGAAPEPTPTPTPTPTPAPTADGSPAPDEKAKDASGGGGIDHAIAEGHVIIIQKRAATKPGEEPKISIGRGDRGIFDNRTGDMTLTGTPSVEQNGNTHSALSPGVVMILHKDNSMETHGPSRTVLKQRKGGNGSSLDIPGGNLGAPAGGPAPNGNKPNVTPPAPSATPADRHSRGAST